MADEIKTDKVTLEELMVSTLAMTDALAKLMIAKGTIKAPIEHGAGELSRGLKRVRKLATLVLARFVATNSVWLGVSAKT